MNLPELKDKKIAVLGFGVNNQALVRYLLNHGIALTVREQKAELQSQLQHPLLTWEIGEKTLDKLEEFQVVFRSPSIPYLNPALQAAAHKKVQIYSQTKLFFDLCPVPIIGVSGSKGKGTTSSLIAALLQAGYRGGKTYLAGNIGVDPFAFLDQLQAGDLVVLELSSFQLQDLHKSPHIAVLLNVTPDHLDHHKSFAEYLEAKRQLLAHQSKDDILIIHDENPQLRNFTAPGKVYRYSKHTPRRQSAWVDISSGQEALFYQLDDQVDSFNIAKRKLIGEHNLENILPAVIVAALYGVPTLTMQRVIEQFPGLSHRLSWVGRFAEIDFYDDSIATTPEACQAAVAAFPERRVHLIAGGSDKGAVYTDLAKFLRQHCVTISLLPGEASKKLGVALKHAPGKALILEKAQEPWFETILSGIQPHLQKGDIILLSPAAASFASFTNYVARAEAFIQAIKKRYGGGNG